MQTGVVKSFFKDKGYGFLLVEGENDVFFHVTGYTLPVVADTKGNIVFEYGILQREPRQGDEVIFVSQKTRKGVQARAWAFHDNLASAKTLISWGLKEYQVTRPKGRRNSGFLEVLWRGVDLRRAAALKALKDWGASLQKFDGKDFREVSREAELPNFGISAYRGI